MANLFQFGDFTLYSGVKSTWKIECDALADGEWKALAKFVSELVGPFSSVEGVPRGGIKLAAELQAYSMRTGPHLIVDDVLTTGRSMKQAAAGWHSLRGGFGVGKDIIGAVVFARGPCPSWIKAVFQMPECFWCK